MIKHFNKYIKESHKDVDPYNEEDWDEGLSELNHNILEVTDDMNFNVRFIENDNIPGIVKHFEEQIKEINKNIYNYLHPEDLREEYA